MDYYDKNALSFVSGTLDVDMHGLYSKFVPYLSSGACILDAGCGSGRDSLYFKQQGFSVTAYDGAYEMAKYASSLIGQSVEQLRFQDMEYVDEFDGVWACASLLHVPKHDLPAVYGRLGRSMRSNAVLYCSFKYGSTDSERDGRRFTNMTEHQFQSDIQDFSELKVIDMWRTSDLREAREQEQWFNALVRKVEPE